jgi:hypothetical protein
MDDKKNRVKFEKKTEQEDKVDTSKGISIDIQKENLAKAIVLAEILGKPVSLRKDRWKNGSESTDR